MPVPVPRQRAIPAVESGQAPAASSGAGPSKEEAPRRADPTGNTLAGDTGRTTAAQTNTVNSAAAGPLGTAAATATAGSSATAGVTDAAARTGLPVGTPGAVGTPAAAPSPTLTLLVIEDDPGGSTVVPELLDSAGRPIRVRTARNLTEAERLLTDDVHCILLDLALPAPSGPAADDELAVLKHVLELAPRHAVLALTASGDAERGAEAVRVGAQDYLFRDELDSRLLSRALRYAVERKRSDTAERRLAEGRLRAQENRRLERGLLPTPLLEGSSLRFAARYRPGRSRALLGGDFYDTVRTPDGTVHAMIGDVCGHGPDEAALGVELRIAWRALTLAGLCGDELLGTLQQVLEHERSDDEIFATLCTVDIAPDGRRAGLCLAGHPSPLIARPGRPAKLLPYDNNGPALGLLPGARWPRMQVELGAEWSLMLYTDGLIEGRVGDSGERLGQDGMVNMVRRQLAEGLRGEQLLRAAVNEVRDLNGGELTDDVAVVLLDRMG
ncbi:PP2C family protein-serine/threonine phosphatase [Streptomyces resistomycificus]|uniref:Phosphatase n=1 Tax=Streptomyces resistomycificus TaxID=67356 RepID=A0A0L8KP73_9ACTN|nr:response regulator [Streptomyces resistomycificus]KOG27766.1 phosphatase [Streptomyces resistomycificus]KUN96421.1 phosphatase [Streptomyces resistomycificus]